MLFQVALRIAKSSLFPSAAVFVGFFTGLAHAAEVSGPKWPAEVRADYGISFNGFEIGHFRLKSKVSGGRYVLDGDAELSALLGAFHWRGITRSSGRISAGSLKPEGYVFNFKSGAKNGMIGMSFGKYGVKSVSMVPQIPVGAGEIPVTPKHLKHVFDPLTSVMVMAAGVKGNPCAAKIPVFDGKQRFDLVLSHKRRETLPLWKTGGRPVHLHVCSVKYRPIAGFKRNKAVAAMAGSTAIEIAMRSVARTGMFIPHRITIPTIAGPVDLIAKKFDILPAGSRRVAQIQ